MENFNIDCLSERVAAMDVSGVRKVFDLARSIDNPINLSIGQPHFDIPETAKKAFMQSNTPMNPFEEFATEIGLLPSFSKVSKYFGIASGYLTSTPDGFYYNAKIMDMPK